LREAAGTTHASCKMRLHKAWEFLQKKQGQAQTGARCGFPAEGNGRTNYRPESTLESCHSVPETDACKAFISLVIFPAPKALQTIVGKERYESDAL
jgi:hypothetical protein